MSATPPQPTRPSRALDEAAHWVVRLTSGVATDVDRAAFERWRQAHPEHQLAWEKAEALTRKFQLLAPVGPAVLDQPASPARRRALKQLVLVLAASGTGWLGYRHLPWGGDGELVTKVGERRSFTLADGTQLTLNTDSVVAIVFDDEQRQLQLRRGEILITTAPDPAPEPRPLTVASGFGLLEALGTRFAVRRYGEQCGVSVYEGAVRINAGSGRVDSRVVRAGQATHFDAHGIEAPTALEAAAPDWLGGMLIVDEMPLAELVGELDRYHRGHLRCDPSIAHLQISGAFPLDDLEQALAAIGNVLPVRVERLTSYWVSIKPRS